MRARRRAARRQRRARRADALGAYGLHLGRAFQIVDDVLDVEGDPRALGKSVLSDVREGKLTLPVLVRARARAVACARSSTPALAADADDAGDVAAAVARTGAAEARARASAATRPRAPWRARNTLPQTPWSEALRYIAHELCARVA